MEMISMYKDNNYNYDDRFDSLDICTTFKSVQK